MYSIRQNPCKRIRLDTTDVNVCLFKSQLPIINNDRPDNLSIPNNDSTVPIYQLPIPLLGYIITFSNIENYAFSLLLVSKYFHHHLSPYQSPHIIKQLIQNECYTVIQDINAFIDPQQSQNDITPWRDWILSASYAWNNDAKIPRIQNRMICSWYQPPKMHYYHEEKDKLWINHLRQDFNYTTFKPENNPTGDSNNCHINDTRNSIASSTYFLNFLYKIRYGGFTKLQDIKSLIEKLLTSYGGALGMRYMIWFFLKEFIFDPLQKKQGKQAIISGDRYHVIFEMMFNIFWDYSTSIILYRIDHKKSWSIGQIYRDLDQILIKYVNAMAELDKIEAIKMQIKLQTAQKDSGRDKLYNAIYA